jgi:hypothetical protein
MVCHHKQHTHNSIFLKDFILKNYSFLILSIELLACVVGFFSFRKYKDTPVKYFIYFLAYALLIETLGNYTVWITKDGVLCWLFFLVEDTLFVKNYWLFQVFWIIGSPLFFSFYYYQIIKNKTLKTSIKYVAISFAVVSIVLVSVNYHVLYSGFYTPITLLGLLTILFLVFSYFIELTNSNTILVFYRTMTFYISCGILVFWLLTTPLEFYEKYFNANDYSFVFFKFMVFLFSIVFMYLIFTIGLLVSNPKNN